MNRVLILEDEKMLRSSMVRGIKKLPNIEVVDAGTMAEALKLIDEKTPQLILSDLDLPERVGVELLGELGKRALQVPIVFISAYVNAFKPQIPSRAGVEVREKPVELDELRDLVQKYIKSGKKNDHGAPFAITDYIQIAAMGHHSVVIEVSSDGIEIGEIIISSGEVWSAHDKDGEGKPAFTRLVFSENSDVNCKALAGKPGKRNINMGWEVLLLDAARQVDENGAPGKKTATDSIDETIEEEISEPESSVSDAKFYDYFDKAVKYLLAGKYDKALPLFLEAKKLRPDDPKIETNLKRLAILGFTDKIG